MQTTGNNQNPKAASAFPSVTRLAPAGPIAGGAFDLSPTRCGACGNAHRTFSGSLPLTPARRLPDESAAGFTTNRAEGATDRARTDASACKRTPMARIAVGVVAVLILASTAAAYTQDQIVNAIRRVESGGYGEGQVGDSGKARGPLQIWRSCWLDSKVTGKWSDCDQWEYSRRVFAAYCKRYEPKAWASGDAEAIARLWNAGPCWRKRVSKTDGYWNKVKKELAHD